jgi:hypothetical protein
MKRKYLIDAIAVVKNLAASETFSYPWILLTTEMGGVVAFADRGYSKILTTVQDAEVSSPFSVKVNVTQLNEVLSVMKGEEISIATSPASVMFKSGKQKAELGILGMADTMEKAAEFANSPLGDGLLALEKDNAKALLSYCNDLNAFDIPKDGSQRYGGAWFRNNYACIMRPGTPKDALFLKDVHSDSDFVLFGRIGTSIIPKNDMVFTRSEDGGVSCIFGNTRVTYSTPDVISQYNADQLFWGIVPRAQIGTVIVPNMSGFIKFGASNIIWNARTKTIVPNEYKDCMYNEVLEGNLSCDMITPVLPIPPDTYNVFDCGQAWKFETKHISYLTGKVRV